MERTYPLLLDRIQSLFIDVMLILVLTFLSAYVLDRFENAPDWIRIVLFFALWVLYEPLCLTLGCTVGNYVKGIRVRRYDNNEKSINFFQAFVRCVIKGLLGWLSFVTIGMNKERRAIHDFGSGSVMIKCNQAATNAI